MVDLSELLQGGPLFAAEAALAARLEEAFPPARFQHSVFPAKLTKAEWARQTVRTPLVGRSFLQWDGRGAGARRYGGMAQFHVYLVSKNPVRSATLRADARGYGQFALAQVALAALHGWTPGAPFDGVGSWSVGSADNAYSDEWGDEDCAVTVLAASVDLRMEVPGAVAGSADFLRLAAAWELGLPGGGEAEAVPAGAGQNVRGQT